MEYFAHQSEPEFLEGFGTDSAFKKKAQPDPAQMLTPKNRLRETFCEKPQTKSAQQIPTKPRKSAEQQMETFMRENRDRSRDTMFGVCDTLNIQSINTYIQTLAPNGHQASSAAYRKPSLFVLRKITLITYD